MTSTRAFTLIALALLLNACGDIHKSNAAVDPSDFPSRRVMYAQSASPVAPLNILNDKKSSS